MILRQRRQRHIDSDLDENLPAMRQLTSRANETFAVADQAQNMKKVSISIA